jgi:hypothetical protein
MKKLLSLGLTLLAATVLPASAMAIDAADGMNPFRVSILTALDTLEDAGIWYLELDSDLGHACGYTVEWVSPTGLISTDCVLAEAKVHGRRSCLRNGCINFPTLVDLGPDCECFGFSELSLLERVEFITLTENFNGLSGVIMLSGPTGTVHGIDISEC